MYSGDRNPTRAGARCHLYRSPAWHSRLPPFIHAVVIRSCSVPCAAESEGAHVGAGEWGHARRAGKWVQA
eukprot:6744009-Prymnesium_polylepis.1